MTDHDIVGRILAREGGFVDHPADKGGPTNRGVTLATLSAWLGRSATVAELRALTESAARDIYVQGYILKPGLNAIQDSRLRAFIVDCAVNHGPGNAVQFLQRALGVADDGDFGPKTKQALYEAPANLVYAKAVAERVRFYGRIISRSPSQAAFAAGWANRVAEFVETT